ncbi:MAG: Holliday junction resolvase RuvX [Chthoniobacterales bacterium]
MSGFALVRRILGVDFGKARIGVAVSDELGMLAHPVETIPAASLEAAAKRIAEIAREKDVAGVVLGMPRQMSGESGTAVAEVNDFAEKLRPLLKCELVLWDERLTTTAAHRALRDAGKKTRQTRGVVDQVAAQMILQGYLDRAQTSRE